MRERIERAGLLPYAHGPSRAASSMLPGSLAPLGACEKLLGALSNLLSARSLPSHREHRRIRSYVREANERTTSWISGLVGY